MPARAVPTHSTRPKSTPSNSSPPASTGTTICPIQADRYQPSGPARTAAQGLSSSMTSLTPADVSASLLPSISKTGNTTKVSRISQPGATSKILPATASARPQKAIPTLKLCKVSTERAIDQGWNLLTQALQMPVGGSGRSLFTTARLPSVLFATRQWRLNERKR